MPDPLAEALTEAVRDAYEVHLIADMIARNDLALLNFTEFMVPDRRVLVAALRDLLDAGVIEATDRVTL